MSHIEFFGPPGAGKSTIYTQLIKSDQFFGGITDDAGMRLLFKKYDAKYNIPYMILPSKFKKFLDDKCLQYRFGHSTLEDFVREFPKFINILSVAMGTVSYEPERVFVMCKRSAEQYQMGIETVRDRETLCLDESFAQRAYTILWRCSDTLFPLEQYFSSVPTPDLLIHVDAPSSVCLDRQRGRNDLVVAKEWETDDLEQVLDKSRNICNKVRDYWARETSVVTIENTGTVEASVEQVSSEILKLS